MQGKYLNPYFERIIANIFLDISKEYENFICLSIN